MFKLPSEDSTKKRSVETLGGRQPPLDLRHGDFVLGGGGEKREPSRRGAEDVCGQRHRLQGLCVCVTCSDLPEDTCVLILLHLLLILKRKSQVSHLKENEGET